MSQANARPAMIDSAINPWADIVDAPPHVVPEDRPHIEAFNEPVRSTSATTLIWTSLPKQFSDYTRHRCVIDFGRLDS